MRVEQDELLRRQQPAPQQRHGRKVVVFLPALFIIQSLLLHKVALGFVLHRSLGWKILTMEAVKKPRAQLLMSAVHSKGAGDKFCDASNITFNKMVVSRRASIASFVGLSTVSLLNNPAIADTTSPRSANAPSISSVAFSSNEQGGKTIPSITVPLEYQPKLSAYTISYKVGNSQFGAIIDTGSPFLLVPEASEASCRPEYRWGCFRPEESQPAAGLGPTLERFDGNEGLVEWREGKFSFDMNIAVNDKEEMNANNGASSLLLPNAAMASAAIQDASLSSQSILFPRSLITFGVISESLLDGPGGIFLGLVKNTDKWIRPSFLGQSDVSAFSVDLRDRAGMPKTLTLYGADSRTTSAEEDGKSKETISSSARINGANTMSFEDMLPKQNAIPLVRDLNKRYGDPTIHYVGVATSIIVNGSNLASTSRRGGKIYCIFDTGCSGMSISPSLFDERYAAARANREKSLWGDVDVELKTISGDTVTLNAKRPITTPLGSERPWGKKLDGHLIVLGLAFLDGNKMTVDIDGDKIWFED